jgi:hypothetical protein
MSRGINHLISGACISLLITGCLKDISGEIPVNEPKITLNSFFNPRFPMVVSLSSSAGVLDTLGNLYLSQAKGDIYENGIWKDSLIYLPQFNLHTSASYFVPTAGNNYKIEARAEGFPSVSGESVLPDSVSIISSEKDTFFYAPNGVNTYWIRFVFQDPPEENNLYHLMVYRNRLRPNGIWNTEPIQFESEDPVFTLFAREYPAGAFFRDDQFNGQTKELLINTRRRLNASLNDSVKFILELRNCSAPYDTYNRTLHEYKNNQGDLFAQPGPVIGNITGGYGIFGGYAPVTDTIRLN